MKNTSYSSQDPDYLEFLGTKLERKHELSEELVFSEVFEHLKGQPGDELWTYNSIEKLCGAFGMALVRDGKVVAQTVIGIG